MQQGKKEIQKEAIDEVNKSYALLNTFLEGNQFLTGDKVTIADIGTAALISNLDSLVSIESESHPNLDDWFKRIQKSPFYKVNEPGLKGFQTFINSRLNK